MIIATVTALWFIFGSGGMNLYSVEYLQPLIEEHVVAGERQEMLVDMVKDEEKKQKKFNKKIGKNGKKLLKINKKYEATREDFLVILDDSETRLLQVQNEYVDFRFKLKEKMTREEWQAVFGSGQSSGS